jgi:hypothetical protein
MPVSVGMRVIPLFFFSSASLLFLILSVSAQAGTKTCTAMSGVNRVALIELYTSEGCSSCPPADNWLRELPKKGLGPDKVVPLAFHVDYWDYIGWADRFAKPEHTQRQRDTARTNKLRTIYTPQVVLNGHDFRHWFWGNRAKETIKEINAEKAKARIGLTLSDQTNLQVKVKGKFAVLPQQHPRRSAAFFALYQNNQTSQVSRGENAGKQLRHDYVVRALHGPFYIGKNGMLEVEKTIQLNPSWKKKNVGIAAFVQDQDSGAILQALAGRLCP